MSKKAVVFEQPVTFTSKESQLVGMLHSSKSDKIIIMCHGFKGDKTENKRLFVEAARAFAQENYDVLRFDFYGSGDSEGEFEDSLISTNIANLTDAVEFVKQKGYKHIAVMGISMGAATVILTANKLDVDAVVLWSAVPDMKKVFAANTKSMGELDSDKTVFEFEGWSIKRDFWEDAVQFNIKKQLAQIAAPKFIVQGTADDPVFVRGFHESREIVLPPADFMEIPDAGHTYQTPGHRHKVIRQTVIWLKRHF